MSAKDVAKNLAKAVAFLAASFAGLFAVAAVALAAGGGIHI